MQEETYIDIIVVDFNGKEIPLKVSNYLVINLNSFQIISYESVMELREFLSEHVYTFLFTNYTLEHNGNPLNDYQELANIDLQNFPRILMRPCKYSITSNLFIYLGLYDDKAANIHVVKL